MWDCGDSGDCCDGESGDGHWYGLNSNGCDVSSGAGCGSRASFILVVIRLVVRGAIYHAAF
jgi:hypothetical protein